MENNIKNLNPYIQVSHLTNGLHRKLYYSYSSDNKYMEFHPNGTVTFIQYKSECFIVTCYHCVKFLFEDNSLDSFTIFAKPKGEKDFFPIKLKADNRLYYKDIENDIVVFSIDCKFMKDNFDMIDFIDEEAFSDLDTNPLDKGDLVFVTGSPFYTIIRKEGKIHQSGLTLKTLFDKHDDDDIIVSFSKNGLAVDDNDEHQFHEIKTIEGLSGGPAFRILNNDFKKSEDEPTGFLEFIGIVHMGSSESGLIYILGHEKIKSILETFLKESFSLLNT